MGTAERTASDKSATLRGINPANTDSTECPNPATAPTATAAKRSSTPTDTELAALAAPYRYTVRDGKKIGQHNGAHFYTIGQRKGLGIGGRKESLFVLATDVEQNVIYVGEGDNHPGLYRRALRIAPGELHWIDPLRELKTGESRRFDVRIRYRQPLQGAELFIRPDASKRPPQKKKLINTGHFTETPAKQATNSLHNPPLHAQNTGSHHVPYRPISDKHFPPKPLSTRRQKKGTAQNTPPANDDKQPRETSLKPEPNIIAILVAAIGIIPPASSIVRKKGAGNEEMPSDKKPPSAIEPRSVNTDRFRT